MAHPNTDLSNTLHISALREERSLHVSHSAALEQRHRQTDHAHKSLDTTCRSKTLFCTGTAAILKLPTSLTRKMLTEEKATIWTQIESTQRDVTRVERQILQAEAEAQLAQMTIDETSNH